MKQNNKTVYIYTDTEKNKKKYRRKRRVVHLSFGMELKRRKKTDEQDQRMCTIA